MEGYELPKGWRWVRLGEAVSEIKSGFACGKQHAVPEGIPHLRTNNIGTNGELDLSLLIHLPAEIVDLNIYSLKSGDVLFNNTNSVELIGKTAIVRGDLPFVFSNHITRLRVKQDVIESEWLTLSLQYLWYQRFFEKECQRWIGQAGFNTTRLKKVQIPLPPLPEQRRIVERIEKLVNHIEEAKSLRHAAREETKAIMPAALCKIFSKANTQRWKHNRIAELITDIKTGTTPPSKETKYYGGNVQWFTPGDLGHSKYLIKSNRTLTATAIKGKKAKTFKQGTILFVGIGATLGKVGIATAKVSSNQQITGLYFGPVIIPDFAYYWFRFKYDYIRLLSSAVTLPIINQEGLKNLVMEFPPLEEQHRIVTYLDHLQAKVVELRRLQEETAEEINATTSAILDRVFQGEL